MKLLNQAIEKVFRVKTFFYSLVLWIYSMLVSAPAFADSISLCPSDQQLSKLCDPDIFSPNNVIKFVITLLLVAAFVIALIFLIIGGIKWILSGGDKEATNKAKDTVTSALIGLVIVLASWVLLNVVTTIFGLGSVNTLNIPGIQ